MTDADFLRAFANSLDHRERNAYADRLRAIATDHERMERELNRITQEGREAHAAMEEHRG